jgi:uroporphyrinogen-III synthase
MANSLPLSGLRIAVTRPREQGTKLCREIEQLGGACIAFPLLDITPLLDNAELRLSLSRLQDCQLAIFISPNAVRYGMEAIKQAGGLPATLQIATIGLSSAKALHELGVQKVIAPTLRFDSEALLALPEMQHVRQQRVLIFRGNGGRELLGDTLTLRGALVEYITCYQRSKSQADAGTLFAGNPDAIAVSSSEALQHLWQLTDMTQRAQLTDLPLFVAHERIATEAQHLGWKHIVSTSPTDAGLLSALTTWAASKKGKQDERNHA